VTLLEKIGDKLEANDELFEGTGNLRGKAETKDSALAIPN